MTLPCNQLSKSFALTVQWSALCSLEEKLAPTPPLVSTCHRAVLPRFKRNPSVDRGSGSRLRLDLEFPVHDLKSFAHADQSETLARQGVMFFKTATAVRNC